MFEANEQDFPAISEISKTEDNIQKRPISEIVNDWRILDEVTTRPFLRFYIACPDNRLDKIVTYLNQQLGVRDSSVINQEIGPQVGEPVNIFRILKQRIQQFPDDKITIVLKGFERFFMDTTEGFSTLGHGFDQNVTEDRQLQNTYQNMGKRIFVFTHIGDSLGEAVYSAAVKSAISSHFKDDLIEVKKFPESSELYRLISPDRKLFSEATELLDRVQARVLRSTSIFVPATMGVLIIPGGRHFIFSTWGAGEGNIYDLKSLNKTIFEAETNDVLHCGVAGLKFGGYKLFVHAGEPNSIKTLAARGIDLARRQRAELEDFNTVDVYYNSEEGHKSQTSGLYNYSVQINELGKKLGVSLQVRQTPVRTTTRIRL